MALKNPYYMNALDIYTSNCKTSRLEIFQEKINDAKLMAMPLMSWDIYMTHYYAEIETSLKRIELEMVISFAQKFNWMNDINKAFETNEYEALIITDNKQNIIWVNNGFTQMTGYSKSFALNKTPRFLQGNKTSMHTKKRIRQKISENKPFREVIINHKKDGSTYKCEVKILPLFNKNETTHFMAFEKRVG
ncbi:PAS domain-containing protein [Winogradskyella poriferorum]|uniref:PAS domain-containing protein n=1 Tax=Winogradskyella poriferorum TaxID=307627 RepID=UPI003D661E0E